MIKETILATTLTALAYSAEPMQWSKEELFAIPQTFSDAGLEKYRVEGVRSFLLEGPKSADGKTTKVYVYYALPDGPAPEGGFPAVVLFHGGGGTAFASYVKSWAARGYAAITFDHYGQEPAFEIERPKRPVLKGSWQDIAGTFGEGNDAMRHLWVHNGVALAIRANTFLRQQKEINPDKIGLLGISWGSVMGSIACSLDHRFAFAALCYGCGNWDLGADGGFIKYAKDTFEPKYFMENLTVPTMWIAGTNDGAFEIAQWQKTYQQAPGTQGVALVVRLDHDHVGWDYLGLQRYVDSFCNKDTSLPRISGISVNGNRARAIVLDPGDGVKRAELIYSLDEKPGVKREWKTLPAEVKGNVVSAPIPAGAKAVYLNIYDRDYSGAWQWPASTDVVEL